MDDHAADDADRDGRHHPRHRHHCSGSDAAQPADGPEIKEKGDAAVRNCIAFLLV